MTPLEALHTYFSYPSFRSKQEDIIASVLDGRDTLALLPTGGGKSICFQIPTLVLASMEQNRSSGALCLVITPLIALMKDQVENLYARNIMAAAIYSGMSWEKQKIAIDNCRFGPYRFLYVSPERLESDEFISYLHLLPIRLIAVDEAHCISQWGYDFRPSYLRIAKLRSYLAAHDIQVPILALTATATPDVVQDIQDKLSFSQPHVIATSFERENLSYVVRRCHPDHKGDQIVHILTRVRGSSIVYVRNRKRAEELAAYLVSQGIQADFYHAGLSSNERNRKQNAWKQYSLAHPSEAYVVSCMVCTNAFGMGIDKPDVRVVIHHDLPDSIEAYFQEAGRAGRDGKPAYAVLLYDDSDKTKARRRVGDTYPDKELVSQIYHKTCDYLQVGAESGRGHTFFVDMVDLIQTMHFPPVATYSALRLLTQAGYIDFEEEQEIRTRVRIRVTTSDLDDYALSADQVQILENLMRKYPGIFTDLQYVDLNENLHEQLSALAQMGIISYVPHTITNTFSFTMDRQRSIRIPAAVYEQRRDHFISKISAMVEYAEQDYFCRSQVLLHYFGDTSAKPCGHCDICRSAMQEKK